MCSIGVFKQAFEIPFDHLLRLRCTGCGREVMLPRKKAEKALKKIISPADQAGEDRRNPYAL